MVSRSRGLPASVNHAFPHCGLFPSNVILFQSNQHLKTDKRQVFFLYFIAFIDHCIANDRGRSPVPRRNPLDPRIDYAKINSLAPEYVSLWLNGGGREKRELGTG